MGQQNLKYVSGYDQYRPVIHVVRTIPAQYKRQTIII